MTTSAALQEKFGVVDYAIYQQYLDGGKQDKELFGKYRDNVMDTLPRTGTILIKNAPILKQKQRILGVSKQFFDLPEETKESFAFPDYDNRGYFAYGKKKPQDFKEFIHVDGAIYEAFKGTPFKDIRNVRDEAALKKQIEIGDIVTDFREASVEFTERAREMGQSMLEVFADYFQLPPTYQANMQKGDSVLRMIHYPPFDKKLLGGTATRAQAHADISALTFLLTSDEPGLQILPLQAVHDTYGTTFVPKNELDKIPAEKWVDVPNLDDCCVMNIGLPTEILSNGILPGTIHRVVPIAGRENERRYSLPFFYHMAWDMPINTWQKAIDMRDGVNYFEQRGPHDLTIEEYVLDKDRDPITKELIPYEEQKRSWIEPPRNKPVPIYVPR